jgi:periplasmic divalent cation tolerance protein
VNTSECLLVLTTLPAAADAGAFATTLVEERLAACANILPEMESVYRWQGHVEHDRERQILIKTTAERFGALEVRIRQLHPHEVPELIAVPIVHGSERYLGWVRGMTQG